MFSSGDSLTVRDTVRSSSAAMRRLSGSLTSGCVRSAQTLRLGVCFHFPDQNGREFVPEMVPQHHILGMVLALKHQHQGP